MGWRNSNETDSQWQWTAALAERISPVWFVWNTSTANADDVTDPADWLDIHAQGLLAGQTELDAPTSRTVAGGEDVAELAQLAEEVVLAICPHQPAPKFRKELRQALLSTHRQQAAQRRIFAHPIFERGVVDRTLLERMEINSPWFWQIAAGVPVLIAIAAIIWRYTHRPVDPTEITA
ncbi:MAG: hypothetical protein WAU10_14470 [Caldilineaceae bacterium]